MAQRIKFLVVLLSFVVTGFSTYMPNYNMSACSCSTTQACQMDHDCPHCNMRKKQEAQTQGMMCHSEKPAKADHSHHAKHKVHKQKSKDTLRMVKIINPGCNSKKAKSFIFQAREPFITTAHVVHKQYVDNSIFEPVPVNMPEQVCPDLRDKPPRIA